MTISIGSTTLCAGQARSANGSATGPNNLRMSVAPGVVMREYVGADRVQGEHVKCDHGTLTFDVEPSFYLADKSAVDGWEFVGSVAHDATEATFAIAKLNGRLASLLFTAYVSLDALNPSASQSMPQGVCTAMSVDSIGGTVTGLSGNWKPDITLIG